MLILASRVAARAEGEERKAGSIAQVHGGHGRGRRCHGSDDQSTSCRSCHIGWHSAAVSTLPLCTEVCVRQQKIRKNALRTYTHFRAATAAMSAPACRSSSRKSKPRELFGFEDLAQPSPIVPRAAKIPSSKSPISTINKNNKSNTSKPAVKPKRSNILLSLKTEAKLADDAASFVAEHARQVKTKTLRVGYSFLILLSARTVLVVVVRRRLRSEVWIFIEFKW